MSPGQMWYRQMWHGQLLPEQLLIGQIVTGFGNLDAKVLSRSNETPEIRLPGQMSPKQMSPGQILQRQMSRHIRLNYTLYG